ncbi:MAG: HNH endonuclease [Armatimonadota bacterium]
MRGARWQESELLAAFALYCRTPFGLMHANNPDIIQLANLLNRSPNAVAMKLCNFAALDPAERERGVRGLSNVSNADRRLREDFEEEPNRIAFESEAALAAIAYRPVVVEDSDADFDPCQTEAAAERRIRLVQDFFRRAVLNSYNNACAVCRIPIATLLNASHIIPWTIDESRRGDPRNGLSLCTLHDRAFDRGLMTVDLELRTVVSDTLRSETDVPILKLAFHDVHGKSILRPHRFEPSPEALKYHRHHIFER